MGMKKQALLGIPLLLVACALWLTVRQGHSKSVFDLSNFLGPVTHSVFFNHDFAVPLTGRPFRGPVTFHSLRMPLPPVFLAGAYGLFGQHLGWIYLLKTTVFLAPLIVAAYLAYRPGATLLALPFLIPNFLLQVVSMQTEEGFYYGILALATAIIIFKDQICGRWLWVFGLSLVGLYFCKSSLRVACLTLLLLSFWRISGMRKLIPACLLALAMLSWGAYQRTVSGHFTLGSSLDGINLHKGNYEGFLDRYPPPAKAEIDRWDDSLSPPAAFLDEWSYDAYHMHAGKEFIVSHPVLALKADAVKLWIYWFSLRDIVSGHATGVFARFDLVNMLLMRVVLLGAIAAGLWGLRFPDLRFASLSLLAVFAAVSLPSVVGFALTRHASVLIYPACLFLSKCVGSRGDHRSAGKGTLANEKPQTVPSLYAR